MLTLFRGRYVARLARSRADVDAALALRSVCFRDGVACDRDAFDDRCQHGLVEDQRGGRVVCTFRFQRFDAGRDIGQSYSAQHYELSPLRTFGGPMVELGRFCIHPDVRDPDVLRIAWGALTAHVDATGGELLFGCSSFRGTDTGAHLDAFALLRERHLGPRHWLPRVKAASVFRFTQRSRQKPDANRALTGMPPLLRSYLVMGGWVSDHAVVDRDLGTLHVFTGLEVRAIPPARKRLLRALAG